MLRNLRRLAMIGGLALPGLLPAPAHAAQPTAEQALLLTPIQADVDFDRPSRDQIAKCTVQVENRGKTSGWVVRNADGQMLRRFLDTNDDNKVDQWCYYKDGIEVYRDIDSNFNNKADQYRWLGTAGVRWGLDKDEDGRIDSWQAISPEEVTAEVVASLRERDAARFGRLLLSPAELEGLGLSADDLAKLKKTASDARETFADVARRQKLVTADSQWIHFGGSKPGVVPAGTAGSSKDLIVYDNVAAIFETDGKHGQVIVGTLVRSGDTWKLFDLPKNLLDPQGNSATGYFFQASLARRPETEEGATGGISPALQKVLQDLEKLDASLAKSTRTEDVVRLNAERAELLDQIVAGTSAADDKAIWIKQYAETVSAAVQSGQFPRGLDKLQKLVADTQQNGPAELVAYVKFRHMTAAYNASLQDKDADFPRINARWLDDLENFVRDYPKSPDAAEAMLQLAISHEFAGKDETATQWYTRIVTEHPSSELARKATGAKRRLASVSQKLAFRGATLDKRTLDLASLQGKTVLIHYWASWCEPCKEDLALIKSMVAKYGKQGFLPVGVILDNDAADADRIVRAKSVTWPQLHEAGGLDSRLATELGVFTLPTMLLVNKNGKVVNRSIHAAELDAELGKLLR